MKKGTGVLFVLGTGFFLTACDIPRLFFEEEARKGVDESVEEEEKVFLPSSGSRAGLGNKGSSHRVRRNFLKVNRKTLEITSSEE